MICSTESKIWPARLLIPSVPCPRCRCQAVQGFVAVDTLHGATVYTLYPCYCHVDKFWMTAFVAEMARRTSGMKPQSVQGRADNSRTAVSIDLQNKLRVLYGKRDAAMIADMTPRKTALEREIVALVTELVRVSPNSYEAVPPITLEPSVLKWAKANSMRLPPGSGEPEESIKLTVEQLHKYLLIDAELNKGRTSRKLLEAAQAMYAELQAFVTAGTPVCKETFQTISKLVPTADVVLAVRDDDKPLLPEPVAFNRTRKRRIDAPKPSLTDEDADA